MTTEHRQIEAEYDTATRSPKTGKLYMPSQKWGGWTITNNGARNSFGSPLYNTKGRAITKAHEEAAALNAVVYLFARKEAGCKLVAVIS